MTLLQKLKQKLSCELDKTVAGLQIRNLGKGAEVVAPSLQTTKSSRRGIKL